MSDFIKENLTKRSNYFCCQCGTCVAVCKFSAIKMLLDKQRGIYIPCFEDGRCFQCFDCLDVCPSLSSIFDVKCSESTLSYYIGEFKGVYIAHSTNPCIRFNSASGGLVTSLLTYALKKGIINGALVTRMRKDAPLEPEPFIARTTDEIIEASGSKYCPVPVNVALKVILNNEGRYAYVGLPCQLWGLKKAIRKYPILRERIVFTLGLFCSHVDTFTGTEFLLRKINIRPCDVSSIKYRGFGWPGAVSITVNNQKKFVKHGSELWYIFHDSMFFIPHACLLCNDVTAEQSDLSFGDPWLTEIIKKERHGRSLVLTRTIKGEQLLQDAANEGFISLEKTKISSIFRSQKFSLKFKKLDNFTRYWIMSKLSLLDMKTSRNFNKKLFIVDLLFIVNTYILKAKIFLYIPNKILKLYAHTLYILYDFLAR